jgi:hypothetical protein
MSLSPSSAASCARALRSRPTAARLGAAQQFDFDRADIPPAERVALQRSSILQRLGLETDGDDARRAQRFTGNV